MSEQPIIIFDDVYMSFGSFAVHKGISFSITKGQVVTLLGPSGTGKTVILKLVLGLLKPTSGSIYVFGKNICEASEAEMQIMRRKIGMLFQGAALFDSLSVFENVAYSLREFGDLDETQISQVVQEKLTIVGLPEVSLKFPPQLSGGQKKRVGLARALASSPEILLFDEPTTGLDPTAIRLIDELISGLKFNFNITSLVVTHDIESARRFSDRWILIDDGKIIADGAREIVDKDNENVRNFVTGMWRD